MKRKKKLIPLNYNELFIYRIMKNLAAKSATGISFSIHDLCVKVNKKFTNNEINNLIFSICKKGYICTSSMDSIYMDGIICN